MGTMLGELSRDEIEHVLQSEVVGRIGCHADGRTYVVPITYAYDGTCVYGHSAAGLKVAMMRSNPAVCFEVEQVDDLANWRSVIAWGDFEELTGDEAVAGLRHLVDRLRPFMTSATAQPTHGLDGPAHQGDTAGHVPVLYRIRLTDRTGRFERR